MTTRSTDEATQLLYAWSNGDKAALDVLMPLVYRELHRMAQRRLNREIAEHTLQPTALVHEAYLRLVDQRDPQWRNRAHFFAIAAEIMRRILVDYARSRKSEKRGGAAQKVSLEEMIDIADDPATDVLTLDEALAKLASIDARKSRMLELRFFGGLTIEETAEVLGVSPVTVRRDWILAKAWLKREVSTQAEK